MSGGKAARLHQFDVDVAILAIPRLVGGTVVQHVLIAKFDSNFGCDVGKFVQILHVVTAAARQLGHFIQQARTHLLFRSPAARSNRLKDADAINLNIGFADCVLDLTFSIAAVIVAAIGDDQDRFARIARLLHLVHGHVDAIQQRGFSLGLGELQAILNVLGVGGERAPPVPAGR